jgi:hypothetical protein
MSVKEKLHIYNNYTDLSFSMVTAICTIAILLFMGLIMKKTDEQSLPSTSRSEPSSSSSYITQTPPLNGKSSTPSSMITQANLKNLLKKFLELPTNTKVILVFSLIIGLFSLFMTIKCSIVYNSSILFIILSIISKMLFMIFTILLIGGVIAGHGKRSSESQRAYARRRKFAWGCLIGWMFALCRLCVQRTEFVSISDCWNGR